MARTSSRCREAAESSRSHAKRGMRCAPSSAPSKLQQSTTPTTEVRSIRRPSPRRRSSCAVQDLRRVASQPKPRQDQRPLQGASLHRIGRRARRPPRAGLGGSLLEGLKPCPRHEEGARAPLGGMLHGIFPSGGHRARTAHRSGIHHQDHPGTARPKGHAR